MFEKPFRVDDSPRPPDDYLAQLTELTSSGRRTEAVQLFMSKAVPDEAVAQARQAPMWPALEAMAHTLVYDGLVMGDGSLPTERLGKVTMPTLVLETAASPAWLRQAAKATAAAVADGQHRTLEGAFHEVPPETMAPVLASFFAG